MNIIQAIILGIVEGVTEFLPISSTAHLILTSKLLAIKQSEFVKLFEVVIQSGAMFAVVFLYAKYVLERRKLIVKILISLFPTLVIGYTLFNTVKSLFFDSFYLIIATTLSIGLVFFVLEYVINRKILVINKQLRELTIGEALLIGLFQGVAVIPGVSRAGIVIIAMLLLRYNREDAVKYSFLLAVPTIFAATALDIFKSKSLLMQNNSQLFILGVGCVTAMVTAYFAVRWLVKFVQNHTLVVFGWYRVILAAVLLAGTLVK